MSGGGGGALSLRQRPLTFQGPPPSLTAQQALTSSGQFPGEE